MGGEFDDDDDDDDDNNNNNNNVVNNNNDDEDDDDVDEDDVDDEQDGGDDNGAKRRRRSQDDSNNTNDNNDIDDDDDEIDDDDRYCYCRLKWDGVAPMLECDGCGEWFHFICVYIDPNRVPSEFFCINCEDGNGDSKRLRRLERALFARRKSLLSSSAYVDPIRPHVVRELACTSDGRPARIVGRPVPTVAALADVRQVTPQSLPKRDTDRTSLLLAVQRLDSHSLTRVILFLKQHAPDAVRIVDLERIELDFDSLDAIVARKLAIHLGL